MKSLPGFTLAVFTLALLAWASGGRISAQPEAGTEAAKPPEAEKTAQAGDQPAEAEPALDASPSPTELIEAARKRLVGYKSIKARLLEVVALGDRRFQASGSYLQGTNLKLRLEYQVTVGATEASLLEVCDGYVLWSRHTIAGRPRITRRDVRQILNAATAAPKSMEAMLIAELGLGGLPALMASVQDAMVFESVRNETIDGKAFKVVEGGWSREFLDGWTQANPRAEGKLPAHLPDGVRIYLNGKTLFPQRIVYLKRDEDEAAGRPIVTLDFVDVVLNGAVNDDEFYFVPPDGVVQEDITNLYLQRLRSAGAGAGEG